MCIEIGTAMNNHSYRKLYPYFIPDIMAAPNDRVP